MSRPTSAGRSKNALGPGDVLRFCYGIFVVAAGARSVVQLVLHASRAPLAYALSAIAAVVYAVGWWLIRAVRHDPRAVPRARVWCCVELGAVIGVGVLSIAEPHLFPDDTVWSDFGRGYLFVPLALPIASLLWLRKNHSPSVSRARASTSGSGSPTSS